jgi:hypothetical protein
MEAGWRISGVPCRREEGHSCRLKAGSAYIPLHGGSNSLLPMLADKETGQFLEIAKGKSLHLLKLAEVSALVVSAAHIIAGMDVVKRLDKVDRKLDEPGACH